ncbi:zinc finger, CCHC-type containing protein [Tanacetum coccineum]
MARSMMKSMQVPDTLWGEVVRQAVYIQNRVPTKTLGDTTPYERRSEKKPNLEHLRVFGCIAYSKVLRGHQQKLNSRSKMLVHLGTETGSKAYRLLDPVSGRIRVSRDVRFEEGYNQEDTNLEDESDSTDEPLEVFEGINDEEFQPTPQTNIHDDEGLSTPSHSPATSVGSTNPTSSTTGGGAPKRFRLLTDLYEECDELLFMQDADEPTSYLMAAKDREWVKAMNVELDAIEKNQTWSLVDLPVGRKPIGLKWVYKLKRDPSGNILKYKARLVAKGYVQKPGVDFDEVFAPVARIETIRILLALASSHGWKVHHLDVKSAFLNGTLEEEVYVTQPEGYVKTNHPTKVYKLSKALYGLRQAPRAWNSRLDKFLKGLNFTRCGLEYGVYTRKQHGNVLIVGVYVDDLIVTGNCDDDVKYFKQQMNKEFEMSDMGLLSYYLGIEVTQHEDGITLKQSAYARNLLLKAGMADCNPSKSPMEHKEELTKDEEGVPVNATLFRSIIGGLRYLTHTRPDIAYAVGIVSRFMEKPTLKHLQAVKRILRYIKGTVDYGLVYTKYHKGDLITGYSDSNHARDVEDRRSTGGNVFYLEENLVTWGSKKQQCVALSSCEAEFMAATTATCQGIWVSRLVQEITGKKAGPFVLYVDNKSAIELIKNPVFHGRSKHIDLRYHFIRECVERGDVVIKHVCSKEQKADILTKPLPRIQFIEMRKMMGVKNITDSELGGKMLA